MHSRPAGRRSRIESMHRSQKFKEPGGPITGLIDWFMVDPILTGVVMIPLVIFGCIAAYFMIPDFLELIAELF